MTVLIQDADLLRRFREGERRALEQVYGAYVAHVQMIVRLRAHWRSGSSHRLRALGAHEVEDMVQEVFAKAFTPGARHAYDGLRPYRPYLSTIARNVVAEWGRRSGREIPTALPVLEQAIDSSVPLELAQGGARTTLMAGIAALPAELLAVFEKRYRVGLSQRQTAESLGIGRQSVRTLEYRLHAAVREMSG